MEIKLKERQKNRNQNPHYVSNKDFTNALKDWINENQDKKSRKDWTQIPPYITDCFQKIIEHYALKGRWRGYTYLDEMKAEAIFNCIKYAHNFKVKYDNAFAYFTQYVENSFRQIWNVEDKQNKIKFYEMSKNSIYNYENINLYDENEE